MHEKPYALVVGGTGFIGSHLVLKPLDLGYRVAVIGPGSQAERKFCVPSSHLLKYDLLAIEDAA